MSLPTNTDNQFCSWADGDLVNAAQTNNLTFDVYNKIAALTNNTLPCIISGAQITNNFDGTINISSGFYRCQDSPSPLPAGAQGFFTVAAMSGIDISTSLGYYIIARIVITNNPIYSGFFYNMGGEYDVIPVGSYQPNTDIILGIVDSGAPIIYYQARDYDYNNLLSTISSQQFEVITSNYNIQITDNTLIITSPNLTLNLPDIFLVASGKQYDIINNTSGIATIHAPNGINIGPSTTFILQAYQSVNLIAYTADESILQDFWQPTASGYIYPSISNPNIDTFSVTNSSGSGFQANNNTRPGYLGSPAAKLSTSWTAYNDFNSPVGVYPSISNPNIDTFSVTNSSGSGFQANNNTRPGYLGSPAAKLSTSWTAYNDFNNIVGIDANNNYVVNYNIPANNSGGVIPSGIFPIKIQAYVLRIFPNTTPATINFPTSFTNDALFVSGTINSETSSSVFAQLVIATKIISNSQYSITINSVGPNLAHYINILAIGC